MAVQVGLFSTDATINHILVRNSNQVWSVVDHEKSNTNQAVSVTSSIRSHHHTFLTHTISTELIDHILTKSTGKTFISDGLYRHTFHQLSTVLLPW